MSFTLQNICTALNKPKSFTRLDTASNTLYFYVSLRKDKLRLKLSMYLCNTLWRHMEGGLLWTSCESAWLDSRTVPFNHKKKTSATNCTSESSCENSVQSKKIIWDTVFFHAEVFCTILFCYLLPYFTGVFMLNFSPAFSLHIINMIWNGAVIAQLKKWLSYRMDDSGSNPGMDFVSAQLIIQSEPGGLSREQEFDVKNAWKFCALRGRYKFRMTRRTLNQMTENTSTWRHGGY